MPLCSLAALVLSSAHAQGVPDLSTHVLDFARGVGVGGVPVTLDARVGDAWRLVGRATTAETGRVSAFTPADAIVDAEGTLDGVGLNYRTPVGPLVLSLGTDGVDRWPDVGLRVGYVF